MLCSSNDVPNKLKEEKKKGILRLFQFKAAALKTDECIAAFIRIAVMQGVKRAGRLSTLREN